LTNFFGIVKGGGRQNGQRKYIDPSIPERVRDRL
jgi:hypothetical protein